MRTQKRLLLLVLFFLLSIVNINLFAQDVTNFYGGRYYVEDRLDKNDLPNGIIHYRDKAHSSISETSTYRPQHVNVLEIPSSSDIKITPWADVTPSRWKLAPLTQIIRDYEKKNPGYKVVAAVNGDFFDINGKENFPYVPEGVHITNGNLYKSTRKSTANIIGFKNDGSSKPLVGNVEFERSSNIYLDIFLDYGIAQYPIDKINQAPGEDEIALYYACYDSNHKIVSKNVENAYVVEEATYALPISENDFYGLGNISSFGDTILNEGMFAIVSNNDSINEYLDINTKIRVQYRAEGAFANVNDAIGTREMFLYNGEYTGKDTATHPRTMVGMKPDGTIIFTVVDGRQEYKGMYGVTAIEMATIMTHYGATEGYNLDGGGSSTMVIFKDGKHQVVNSPSDPGGMRSDANGIMIVVKVPVIDYSVTDINDNSLTINANVIDKNGYEFDKLYVGIGDEIKEVTNGKATFTNLDNNREYVYTFYKKIDDNFESLIVADTVYTAKIMPQINYLLLSYDENSFVIEVDIYDPDNAINKKVAYLDNNFTSFINGKAKFNNFNGNIDDLYIKYTYDLQDGNGSKEIILNDYRFGCDMKVLMKVSLDKITKKLLNIYH